MRARVPERSTSGAPMPPHLAAGPIIEKWAAAGHRMPQWSALRNWQRAVQAWGIDVGLTGIELQTAQNMARTARPWSRAWFVEDGRQTTVDYLEGRRADQPEQTGWRPRVRPGEVVVEVEPPT